MATPERWDYAQRKGILEMARAGVLMLILSWPMYRFTHNIGKDQSVQVLLELGLLIAICAMLFLRVERAIKARFGPLP